MARQMKTYLEIYLNSSDVDSWTWVQGGSQLDNYEGGGFAWVLSLYPHPFPINIIYRQSLMNNYSSKNNIGHVSSFKKTFSVFFLYMCFFT